MDRDSGEAEQAVNIMTLHSAKGLEFDTVFLPGWEEGLFPHQRSLDESGRNGLEEERRLAHVGITRARKRAKIYFATNRRIHGMWTTTVPSRFLDELPEANVEVKEPSGGTGGFGMSGYGASRFDEMNSFGSSYTTPGWQRAQQRKGSGGYDETGKPRAARGGFSEKGQPRYVPDGVFDSQDTEADSDHLSRGRGRAEGAGEGVRGKPYRESDPPSPQPSPQTGRSRPSSTGYGGEGARGRRPPLTIEGELIAKSTGTASAFDVGARVFHQKFGNGNVVAVDGNKLTIKFDHAGEKRVVDSFVERV
jgi:DNA helicase-2/ATP-dependent DNA helicase PcrA